MEGIDEHKTIPNMKNMIICSIAVLSAALLAACTETTRIWPEEGESKAYVEVSSQKVIFDADGGNAVITVATNADGWDYAAEGDWFTVARQDGNALLVETLINAGAETLTGKLTVNAEKNGETVSQEVALVQRAERSVNLSAEGTANCYIARTGGVYKFDASVKGNGGGDGVSDYIANYGLAIEDGAFAELLWESRHDGDKTMSREIIDGAPIYRGGYVTFSTGRSEGNAVIAVKDIKGNIVWSWHIWVCNDEITAHDHIDSEGKVAAVIMDRNLGALNNTPMDVGNRGMFYEWGRKDPFTPSRSPYHADTDGNNVPAYNEPNTAIGDGTGTWVYNAQAAVLATPPANIPNSILNPMTYLQSPYNGHADWYCTGTDPKATHPGLWGPEKTIFDPCPPGYKVPGPDLWGIPAGNNSITNGGAAADYDETGVSAKWDWNAYEDCGRRWKNTGDYYPMAGNIYYTDYISVSICNYTGGMAFYWTAQATPDATKSSAYFVNFNPNWCNYRLGEHDCSAQIRCIRE